MPTTRSSSRSSHSNTSPTSPASQAPRILQHKPPGTPTVDTVYLVQRGERSSWEPADNIREIHLFQEYFQSLVQLPVRPRYGRTRMLLLGNSGVGKTTFIRRLSDYPFSPAYQPTGFYAMSAISPVLDIIEMPGSELYRTFPSDAFRGVDRVVVMLSLDDAETLYTYSQWIQKVQHLDKPVLLLVNKSDLDAEPQTTIFTLMSLRAESNPWRFVSSCTDSKDHLLYTLLR